MLKNRFLEDNLFTLPCEYFNPKITATDKVGYEFILESHKKSGFNSFLELPASRKELYSKLVSDLKILKISKAGKKSMLFTLWRTSDLRKEISKGIEFCGAKEVPKTISNTNQGNLSQEQIDSGGTTFYSSIAPSWYVSRNIHFFAYTSN